MPIARELFAQWRRARGSRTEQAATPFRRNWADLLEDAALTTALEEQDAMREIQELAAVGLVEVKPVRYKAHLIDRVLIPLAREQDWCNAFGFAIPTGEEARQISNFNWEPELCFIKNARLNLTFAELRQLDDFLKNGGRTALPIPIKERSFQIFRDEKRLDILYSSSALFDEGRLSLDHLRCFTVPEPFGWKRGTQTNGPVMVLENLATWHTYARFDAESPAFSAIVYGGGKRFIDSVIFLWDLFVELGGPRPVFYFGDIDPAGLRIPRVASGRAVARALLPIQPHLDSYRLLLRLAAELSLYLPVEAQDLNDLDLSWIEELSVEVSAVLCKARIPQELITIEHLRNLSESVSD